MSAKAAMVLRSQQNIVILTVQIILRSFIFQYILKLFTYSQNYERRAGKLFFCQFTTLLIIFGEFVHVVK